jgi:hypothetical protein
MKAILINAENQTVEQVDIPDNKHLETYYSLLKCECVTVVEIAVQRNHSLYLDDEVLLSDFHQYGFSIFGQEFVGNGPIVGYNPDEGEDVDVRVTSQYITGLVQILDRSQIDDEPRIEFYS